MAKRVLIHVNMEKEILELILNLRSRGLKDGDLHYFKFAMGTKTSWYNYVLQMGCNKIKADWEQWKKMQGMDKEDKDGTS